jgi:hypothetical protein
MELRLTESDLGLKKLFRTSWFESKYVGVLEEAPNLYIWIHMNEDKNLTENPMICIHNANLREKTKSSPYFSSGVIVLCKQMRKLWK